MPNISDLFSGVLTPQQMQAMQLSQQQELLKTYAGDSDRPWRFELANSMNTLGNSLPGSPMGQLRSKAADNQDVLRSATQQYAQNVKGGMPEDQAQLKMLGDAIDAFSTRGDWDSVSALAPQYMNVKAKFIEMAKLKQEERNQAAQADKNSAQADESRITAQWAPLKAQNDLLNGVSTRSFQAAEARNMDRNASKTDAVNIVDLTDPKAGVVTAKVDPVTQKATIVDAQGRMKTLPAGQYKTVSVSDDKSGGGDTIADKMNPTMLASVRLDVDEVRSGLEAIKGLKADTTGPFFSAVDKDNPLAAVAHRQATPEEQANYEVYANRLAVAIASMQSMGRGQISEAKVNEARKLVPQPGDSKSTISTKLGRITRITDLAEKELASPIKSSKGVGGGEYDYVPGQGLVQKR